MKEIIPEDGAVMEKAAANTKKFIRLKECADLEYMEVADFKELARDMGIAYKIGTLWLINCEALSHLNNQEGGTCMKNAKEILDKTKANSKKFVRYNAGAEMYGMGLSKFVEIARDAGAIYKVGKMCPVNTEALDRYLEGFRLAAR